jgi:hypothetical protein
MHEKPIQGSREVQNPEFIVTYMCHSTSLSVHTNHLAPDPAYSSCQ